MFSQFFENFILTVTDTCLLAVLTVSAVSAVKQEHGGDTLFTVNQKQLIKY
jgi:hypothetical protein